MKKYLRLVFVLLFCLLMSCNNRNKENNILQARGYEYSDIAAAAVSNSQGERVNLAKSDVAFLKDYYFHDDFPADRYNELFMYPDKVIIITFVDDSTFYIYALKNGDFAIASSDEEFARVDSLYKSKGTIADHAYLEKLIS